MTPALTINWVILDVGSWQCHRDSCDVATLVTRVLSLWSLELRPVERKVGNTQSVRECAEMVCLLWFEVSTCQHVLVGILFSLVWPHRNIRNKT